MSQEIDNFLNTIVNPFQLDGDNPDSTVLFNLTGENGGIYHAEVKNNVATIKQGSIENPTLTLTADYADVKKMISGEENPVSAFMTGKIKLQGDYMLALKLVKAIKLP
ncbi:MAG: SCP2 sterol-binding domain-containing protein [Anaerolineaceae bacterium]|nr:SCP2 sterol-binding domain-containing protein [Anaerolineaceae bacterium]